MKCISLLFAVLLVSAMLVAGCDKPKEEKTIQYERTKTIESKPVITVTP